MKYLKVTLAVLVLAIICNATGVFATSSPIMVSLKLLKNKDTYTSYRQKDDNTVQKYEHSWSATDITRPCPNCRVQVTLINSSGKIACTGCSVTTKMENTYSLLNNMPGKYKLRLSRQDPTIWNTDHVGTWHIDY